MAGVTLTRSRDQSRTAGREPVRGRRHRGESLTKVFFVLPAAVAMAALFGYPVVKNLLMSLQDYGLRTFFTGEAPWFGLKTYSAVVTARLFANAMINPPRFPTGSIAFPLPTGLPLPPFFPRASPPPG